MIAPDAALHRDFFIAGGTMRSGAASYVPRPADAELLAATMAGEFCYVLTPRQMGKSSLMVRTARQLQAAGVRTVILDLTSIGTEVTVEQWYLGLMSRINARLNRAFDLTGWWAERAHLGIVQRFTEYLREMLLQQEERVVIFIDEIDTTLSLDFRDDFFAAIRYFYNMRSDEPGLERLSIALLGVATPADLIRDRTRTPFNIGRRIDLLEFSREDARILEDGLEAIFPGRGAAVFDRIYHWTAGHPYLTQKLCQAASEDAACAESPERVDDLVHALFLSEAARRETNLQFIRDNIQGQPVNDQRQIVKLYRDVRRGKLVAEDERSTAQNRLKLIGLVKGNSSSLQVRNNIYRTVFDEGWIKQALPVDWNRRIAVAAIIALLVVALGSGAFLWNSRQQTTERLIAEQDQLFQSGNPAVRLTSLAALYEANTADAVARADELVGALSPEERLVLFAPETVAGLDAPLHSVAFALAARQIDDPDGAALLAAIAAALDQSPDGANVLMGNGIEQWLSGRVHQQAGETEEALADFRDAESLLDRTPVPGLYYELGVAYILAGDPDNALLSLEQSISESRYQPAAIRATLPDWQARVRALAIEQPDLLGRWSLKRGDFPALTAILPLPTATPPFTATAPPTQTTAASPTPDQPPTGTPTPTATDTVTPPAEPSNQLVNMLLVVRSVNLRRGPGLAYPVAGVAPTGAILEVLGRTDSAEWFNVLYENEPAWISATFAEFVEGDIAAVPLAATIPVQPTSTRPPSTATLAATPALTAAPTPGGQPGTDSGPAPATSAPAPTITDTPPPAVFTQTPEVRVTPTR